QPADARSGEEGLREGADVRHLTAAIERAQRRDLASAEPQVALELVLEHRHAVASHDGEEAPAVLERGRDAGGVLERRHRAHQAYAAGRQDAIERVEIEALRREWHRNRTDAHPDDRSHEPRLTRR